MTDRHVHTTFLDLIDGVTATRWRRYPCASCDQAAELHRAFEDELSSGIRRLAAEPLPAGTVEQGPERRRVPTGGVSRRMFAGALTAVVVIILVARGPTLVGPTISAAAVAALQEAATVAVAEQRVDVGDGYHYTRTEAVWRTSEQWGDAPTFTYLRPVSREIWKAADGSGRLRETVGEPIFLSEADREAWIAVGSPPVHENNIDFRPGEGAFTDVSSLPTDVGDLSEEIRTRAEAGDRRPVEVEMFVIVGEFLTETVAPPKVRAALYEVASTLPGVELVGPMTDHAGRNGIGVAMTDPDSQMQEILIFDADTSALLEHQTIGLEDYGEHEAPVMWGHATYLESAVVPELPAEDDAP